MTGPVTPNSELLHVFANAAGTCAGQPFGQYLHHAPDCCTAAGIAAVRPLIEAERDQVIYDRLRARADHFSDRVRSGILYAANLIKTKGAGL